jgi:hypothetical protein
LGALKKLNARLKPLMARASAMKLMPRTMDVIPSFDLPENALSCLPILSFMSNAAADRSVAWPVRSTGRGPLSVVAT